MLKNVKMLKIYQSLVKLPYKQMQTNHLVTPKYAWAGIKLNWFHWDKFQFVMCAAFNSNLQLCIGKYGNKISNDSRSYLHYGTF